MCALTMDDNVFVLLEDPAAPMRADVLAAAPPGQESNFLQTCSHFRTTFLTLRPPGALEQLMAQMKARWVSVRQITAASTRGPTPNQQITIDGQVFSIGNDWIVRIGNVTLAGGAVKGMLLEVSSLYLSGSISFHLSRPNIYLYLFYTPLIPMELLSYCPISSHQSSQTYEMPKQWPSP